MSASLDDSFQPELDFVRSHESSVLEILVQYGDLLNLNDTTSAILTYTPGFFARAARQAEESLDRAKQVPPVPLPDNADPRNLQGALEAASERHDALREGLDAFDRSVESLRSVLEQYRHRQTNMFEVQFAAHMVDNLLPKSWQSRSVPLLMIDETSPGLLNLNETCRAAEDAWRSDGPRRTHRGFVKAVLKRTTELLAIAPDARQMREATISRSHTEVMQLTDAVRRQDTIDGFASLVSYFREGEIEVEKAWRHAFDLEELAGNPTGLAFTSQELLGDEALYDQVDSIVETAREDLALENSIGSGHTL